VYIPAPQYQYYGYDSYAFPPVRRFDHGYGYPRDYLLPRGRDYDRHGRRPDPQQRNIGVRPRSPMSAPPTVSPPPRVMQPPRVMPAPRP
jgi:hypothetical protein